jgi:hypothetical protein
MMQTYQVLALVNDCSGKDGLVDVRALVNELLSASKPAALDQGYVTALIKRMQDYCDSLAPPMARGLMAEAVRALLAASPAAPAQLRDAQDERADALCDSSYCAGLQQGFTFGQHDDNEGLHKALAARDGYVKVLREAHAPAQSREPAAWVIENNEIPENRKYPRTLDWYAEDVSELPVGTKLYAAPQPAQTERALIRRQYALIDEYAQYYSACKNMALTPFTFEEYAAKVEKGEF